MGDLVRQLKSCLAGNVCFIGIGNVDCGDDGFGVRLAEELQRRRVPNVVLAGTNPEVYLGQVGDRLFDHVLFLDAVAFGGEPGSTVLLNALEIMPRYPQVSTHKISSGLLAQWVESDGKTRAWLLGVEPGSVQPTSSLTGAVQTTLSVLADLLCSCTATQGSRLRAIEPAAKENV